LPRVSARLERTEDDLNVHLMSEDLPSLRAAINSFLRWGTMAAEVAQGANQLNDNTYDPPVHQGG
ncbi:MAG: CTAG/PCC1 family protein, partial [Thermoplasmata archaeon]|nr:CTAG/PCC1 family protein [Thermoplasmata archaeon]